MVDTTEMTDEQFQSHAMRLLGKELGVDGLARFIRLNRAGRGNYTRNRSQWLDDVTLEELKQQRRLISLPKSWAAADC